MSETMIQIAPADSAPAEAAPADATPAPARRRLPSRGGIRTIAATLIALTFLATTCGDDGGSASDSTGAVQVPHVYDFRLDAAAAVTPVDTTRTGVVPAPVLRGLLEQALMWHGISLTQVMRAAASDDPDIGAWVDQLTQNTLDITSAIGLVYGPDAARAFNQQWAQHTQFLVDYAVAIGDGDDDAADEAATELQQYATDAGTYFATVTAGALHAEALTELLNTHVEHMLAMVSSSHAGDLAAAVDVAVTDESHLASIGHVLSTAIVEQQPAAFPGSTETPEAAFCTIVTTKSAAYIVSSVMTGDPADPQVLDAAASLTESVGSTAAVFLGLDGAPLTGGAASVAAAARRALDQSAVAVPTPPGA